MISFGSIVIGAGTLAMLYSFWKTGWINKQDQGTEKMERIAKAHQPELMKLINRV